MVDSAEERLKSSFRAAFVLHRHDEREVLSRTQEIGTLASVDLARRGIAVLVSEIMRLNDTGNPVLGFWESGEQRIVVRRDQMADLACYAGTLLHESGT